MQSNERNPIKQKKMQMELRERSGHRVTHKSKDYQDRGKNTTEKKTKRRFSTIHYCQINYEVLSLRSERLQFFLKLW
jgi:hypothetical protein